jgi:hypothetical protein
MMKRDVEKALPGLKDLLASDAVKKITPRLE